MKYNKYQDGITFIISTITLMDIEEKPLTYNSRKEVQKHINNLLELVDRTIPMKVIINDDEHIGNCPKCNSFVNIIRTYNDEKRKLTKVEPCHNFCPKCGQALGDNTNG